MNDILNFKSITTYRLKLPLQFNFKTAKGEVKERETIVIRIEDQQGYVGYGECVAFTEPFLYRRDGGYVLAKTSR